MPAARFLVSGRVQGVFFRASTQRRARELGIEGEARNRADGRVEVLAGAADETALDALERWLRVGPPRARVEALEREALDPAQVPRGGFFIA